MSNEQELKCSDKVDASFESRISDIMEILHTDEFNDYGLSFDLVEAGTFSDQNEPYYRYQLSWGGPSEEFRYFHDRIEFWYLDWFDGACVDVSNDARVEELFDQFIGCDMIDKDKLQPIYCAVCENEYVAECGDMCADCQEEYDNENRQYDVDISFVDITREDLIEELGGILHTLKQETGDLSIEIDHSDMTIAEA